MKRVWIIFAFVLVVASCGKRTNTLSGKDNEFKVKDTANIDKIFLANKGDQSVLLTKEGKKWRVNGEFDARPDLLNNLLYTIRNVEVKQFVPKNSIDNTLKLLAVSATKVEIYVEGKLHKVYYVGGPTQDHFGTYMVMQGSETPYICYLPGFRGYLTNHYIPNPDEWRSRQVFTYHIEDIASVKTEFYRNPEDSWEIIKVDNNNFKLKSPVTGEFLEPFDTGAVKNVLKQFKALGFESFATINPVRLDSVKAKYPLYKISVTSVDGELRTLDLFEIPLQPGTYTVDGREAKVDVDRMYGIVDGKTTTVCQYFTYDPVTVPVGFFAPREVIN